MSADVLERLKPVCYSGDDRPNISSPFRMEYEGIRWAAATNGHALVAMPFDGELRTDGPDAAVILRDEPPPKHAVRLSVIKEWAGLPHPKKSVCPTCKGTPPRAPYTGIEERGRYCEPCDSLGKITEYAREGLLLVDGLNRILLAKVLCTVPDGIEVLHVGQKAALHPYIFRCEGWIAAVMPMRGLSDKTPRLEVQPLPAPAEKAG